MLACVGVPQHDIIVTQDIGWSEFTPTKKQKREGLVGRKGEGLAGGMGHRDRLASAREGLGSSLWL